MSSIQGMRILQDAHSYLVSTYELTTQISMAQSILEDAVLSIWNDPNTNRAEYWQ